MTKAEGNKLIASFMGLREGSPDRWYNPITIPHEWFHDLKYDRDWNWLKPVVERIGKFEFDEVNGLREYMHEQWSESKINIYSPIEIVWIAVVQFIEWYNANCLKQEVKRVERKEAIVLITGKGVRLTYLFLTNEDRHRSNYELRKETEEYQLQHGGIFTYYHPDMDFTKGALNDGSKIIIDNRNK